MLLHERQCDNRKGRCNGFDTAFNQWTLGGYVLSELFLRFTPADGALSDAVRQFQRLVATIVLHSSDATPAQRGTIDAFVNRLLAFADQQRIELSFAPLSTELLAPFARVLVATAEDEERLANAEALANPAALSGELRSIERDARHRTPMSKDLVLSILHVLHPIQAQDALRNFSPRERLEVKAAVASETQRFLDRQAAAQLAPLIDPQSLDEQLLAHHVIGQPRAATLPPTPLPTIDAVLRTREMLEKQRKERIAKEAALREERRQQQLRTGLDLEPWRNKQKSKFF